jgi:putative membrane protein
MAEFHPGFVLNALVYAVLGILIFVLSFAILDKMTPYALWKEIVEEKKEEKNVALAILVGAMSVGMCIIIASAVH